MQDTIFCFFATGFVHNNVPDFMLRVAMEEAYKSMLFTSLKYNISERRPKLVVYK